MLRWLLVTEPHRQSVDIEVRYQETDQMGVVHHANYLVWFELARTALCRGTGHPYADIEEAGFLLIVSGAELRYRAPARYGDTVRVVSWIDRLESRRMRFAYEVYRDGDLLVTGTTEHIWVDADTRRTCRMPDLVSEDFRRMAGE